MHTLQQLRELLRYDPETGRFTWLADRLSHGGKAKAGARAGSPASYGYRLLNVLQGHYKEHRLAWFFVHGEWPARRLDHINGDRSDNRIANLRLATNSQNTANGKARDRASGYRGVYQAKGQARWFAQISVDSRSKSLGTFDTPEEAHQAYVAAAREHFGEFARTD